MKRMRSALSFTRNRSGFTWLAIAATALGATGAQAQSVLTRHVRPAVSQNTAQAVGRLAINQTMKLDIVLPLRDEAGLNQFLHQVYDPNSPNYQHFLTPAQFASRFGASQAHFNAVVAFAKANGFKVTASNFEGRDVQMEGPVSAVQAAFHVNIHTYQHPDESRTFFSADREPTTNLPFALWHVSGLDNYSIPHPLYAKKSEYAKAHGMSASKVVPYATTGSGPSASFLGSDMRAAYYGGTLTGAGQTVGLLEYYGTNLSDLATYYTNAKQTYNSSVIKLVSTDGTSTACNYSAGCDDTEQTLDMTQALGMAPGLSNLIVYVGSSDTAMISGMVTTKYGPLPGTIGCSWGWTPADPSTLDPYFKQMASQGQNFFAASGDSSTWSRHNEAWPADDAYVVSVGGTDLITASAAGPWKSETAWASSGGGISPDRIAIPSWQKSAVNSTNGGSTTYRNGPDVSANANYTFYTCANQTTCLANQYGGTSFAAPMWAGYIALVNQQRVTNNKSQIGFIDPLIYSENATASTYSADFHDITSGKSGSYSAVTNFDLVTGWGSPNSGLFGTLVATP